jgi:hypothetical protein
MPHYYQEHSIYFTKTIFINQLNPVIREELNFLEYIHFQVIMNFEQLLKFIECLL